MYTYRFFPGVHGRGAGTPSSSCYQTYRTNTQVCCMYSMYCSVQSVIQQGFIFFVEKKTFFSRFHLKNYFFLQYFVDV